MAQRKAHRGAPSKRMVKKMRMRKMRVKRAMRTGAGVPEWASLTEIKTLTYNVTPNNPTGLFVANVVQQCYNLNLSLFSRATAVAQNYQQFRIKNVRLTFKPLFDTYQAGASGCVPYLFYLVDKLGQYQNITTIEQFKRIGAKPFRLDDKDVIVNFKPAVLTKTYDNQDGGLQNNQYRLSPWLTTNDNAPSGPGIWTPSGVDHNGIRFVVQQDGGSAVYRVELQVEFEFKKAYINTPVEGGLPVNDIFPEDNTDSLQDYDVPTTLIGPTGTNA